MNINSKRILLSISCLLALGLSSIANAAALSTLSAASATDTFDSLNFAQTWNWSTASTQNPFSFNFNGLTSGSGLRILSSATGLTGNLQSITLSGSNAANTGNLLFLNQSGASSAAIPLNISNSGTGSSFKVLSGTVPFVITSAGKVGIANSSPSSLLTLGTAGTTAGTLSLAGSTSGIVTLQTLAAAGGVTITFPATTGTVITSGDSGTVTNSMLAGSIASSKLIGTDIDTLGTITTGTWNGSTLGAAYGGTGATTLTSHGVVIGNGTSAVNTTSAGTAGQVLTSNGAGADPTFQTPSSPPSSPMTLLKANSGTYTSTSAGNIDTISLSGLTSLDSIMIYYTVSAAGSSGGEVTVYNSTDGVTLGSVNGPNDGFSLGGTASVQQEQQSSTTIWTTLNSVNGGIPTGTGSTGQATVQSYSKNVSTGWTGSWTLALRSAGVGSGCTLHWSWKVYKIAGQ
jgi:hypothetical protein